MINAIYFGAFAMLLGIWIAGMVDDFDSRPLRSKAAVYGLYAGGLLSVIAGFILLGISDV